MATADLGQVRDKITGTRITGGSTSAGQTANYTLLTEMNPNGIGSFSVYNGKDGNFVIETTARENGINLINTIKGLGNDFDLRNIIAIVGCTSNRQELMYFNPIYTFTQNDATTAQYLNDIELHDEAGNVIALTDAVVQAVYYTSSPTSPSNKLDGVIGNAVYTDMETMCDDATNVDGVFVAKAKINGRTSTYYITHRTSNGVIIYDFVSDDWCGTAARVSSSVFTIDYKSAGIYNIGIYNDVNTAFDHVSSEYEYLEDRFAIGGKASVSVNGNTYIILGHVDEFSGDIIGYVPRADENEDGPYFFTAHNTSGTWSITKIGQKHLYKHELSFSGGTPNQYVSFISKSPTPITAVSATFLDNSNVVNIICDTRTRKGITSQSNTYTLYTFTVMGYEGGSVLGMNSNGEFVRANLYDPDFGTFQSDTVTELL